MRSKVGIKGCWQKGFFTKTYLKRERTTFKERPWTWIRGSLTFFAGIVSVISAFQILAHAQPHCATEFFFLRIQFGAFLIRAPRKWNRKSVRKKNAEIPWILMIFSKILLKKLVFLSKSCAFLNFKAQAQFPAQMEFLGAFQSATNFWKFRRFCRIASANLKPWYTVNFG